MQTAQTFVPGKHWCDAPKQTRNADIAHLRARASLELVRAAQIMRQWAANRTAAGVPTPFLDFDAWSTAPDVPGACAKKNKHYACHLRLQMEERPDVNYWREPRHNVRLLIVLLEPKSRDGAC